MRRTASLPRDDADDTVTIAVPIPRSALAVQAAPSTTITTRRTAGGGRR